MFRSVIQRPIQSAIQQCQLNRSIINRPVNSTIFTNRKVKFSTTPPPEAPPAAPVPPAAPIPPTHHAPCSHHCGAWARGAYMGGGCGARTARVFVPFLGGVVATKVWDKCCSKRCKHRRCHGRGDDDEGSGGRGPKWWKERKDKEGKFWSRNKNKESKESNDDSKDTKQAAPEDKQNV